MGQLFEGGTYSGALEKVNNTDPAADAILQKIAEYAERYGVEYIIDIIPLGIK